MPQSHTNYLVLIFVFYLFTVDLSFQKVASQPSSWFGFGYDAYFAVDGNISTCMRTEEIGFSSRYKTTWWKVDLGGVYSIYSINVLFKNYAYGYGTQICIFLKSYMYTIWWKSPYRSLIKTNFKTFSSFFKNGGGGGGRGFPSLFICVNMMYYFLQLWILNQITTY